MATNNPNGPPAGNPSGDKSYDKTILYIGLAAAGVFVVYKAFSVLGGIASGGGGGGGGTCPTNPTLPRWPTVLKLSKDTIGTTVSNWLQSSPGWATFLASKPGASFLNVDTLNAQGYNQMVWTFEYPFPYTYNKYYFYPTLNAAMMCSYASTPTLYGQTAIYPYGPASNVIYPSGSTQPSAWQNSITPPDGCLIGKLGGTTLSNAVYGLQYVSSLPLVPGVTMPNPNGVTLDGKFYLFMVLAVQSWRITSSTSCPGAVMNSDSGPNVTWTL